MIVCTDLDEAGEAGEADAEATFAFVRDTSVFGATSPVMGQRFRLDGQPAGTIEKPALPAREPLGLARGSIVRLVAGSSDVTDMATEAMPSSATRDWTSPRVRSTRRTASADTHRSATAPQ